MGPRSSSASRPCLIDMATEYTHTRYVRKRGSSSRLSGRPGVSGAAGGAAFAAPLDVAALLRLGAAVGHRAPAPAPAAGAVEEQPAAPGAAVQDRQVGIAGEQPDGGVAAPV